MAIIMFGKTTCGICDRVVSAGEPIKSFPAFLKQTHTLAKFSDGVFHAECYDKCPERDAVNEIYGRFRAIWDSRPRNLTSLEQMEAWGIEAFRDFE